MRGKVGFITPENEIISMPYHKVLSYCQDICNNSNNRDKFIEFAKDYDYFSAYFDYVMFELNYIFINPLFHTGTYLYHCHDSLYLNKLEGFDYSENVREAVKVAEEEDVIPYITRCSQKSMNIKPQTPESVETCMIDPNLIGMMISTWVTGISHGITANTVLNQLLLTNHNITN